MNERVRVLIVDDSALVRSALREMLESDSEICVVGEASNGREALLKAQELKPSIVTMDVRMPVMDGLETTEQLMAYNPTPVLAITALYSRDDVDISFKMLGVGALDVIEKPDLSSPAAYERARQQLIRRVKVLSRVRVVTHLRGRRRVASTSSGSEDEPDVWRVVRRSQNRESPSTRGQQPVDKRHLAPVPKRVEPTLEHAGSLPTLMESSVVSLHMQPRTVVKARFPLVVIGSSTGGPRIVQQILSKIPSTFGAAVLVVQHIAEGFAAGMVEWLDTNAALPVELAQEGDQLQVGKVLVAPDGFHLFVQSKGFVHLDDEPVLQKPAVDIAMKTAAEVFTTYATGVLLTGMGRDGAIGMQSIRGAGGYTIAQDEASCSIYGMPRAAVEIGAADEVLPPEGIVLALLRRVGEDA